MDTTNRDNKYAGNESIQGGLYDVVMALRSNIMRNLNVATLAEVQFIDTKTQIVTVKPFPLLTNEDEKNIDCFSCMIPLGTSKWVSLVDNLSVHDVVLVVFTNRNSIQSLQQARKNQKITTLNENAELHSERFGIIVALCYKYNK